MSEKIALSEINIPNLKENRVVIIGGTGAVGEGIIRSWLQTGAQVIVPSRSEGRVAQFKEKIADLGAVPNLFFIVGGTSSFEDAEAMAERITNEFGPVTDVVASIGGWWRGGSLWEVKETEWQHFFVGFSTAHVANVRAWIPRLPQTGSYQLVLGGSAEKPVPGSSIINMEQAALLMMRQVLSAEAGGKPRVLAFVLGPVVTRMRKWIEDDWVSATEVGFVSAGIAAGNITDVDFGLRSKSDIHNAFEQLGLLKHNA